MSAKRRKKDEKLQIRREMLIGMEAEQQQMLSTIN
jgi:hypothetical protein